jgi:hypothetical protein
MTNEPTYWWPQEPHWRTYAMPLPTIQRTIDQIQRDISWKFQRVNDSQEHAQIVKLEEDIAKLQRELKTVQNATQLPTPDEPMVGDEFECGDCLGTGEVQAINLGDDSHAENLSCPTCVSREHTSTIRELEIDRSENMTRIHGLENANANLETKVESLQSELAAANARTEGAYARGVKDCGQICKSWVECFGGRKIIHTTAQQYATDAMNDVIDLMHALLPNSKKEPHEQA